MSLFPKTQEGQGLMVAALFLIAGNIAYWYFGSIVLGVAFLSGMAYSLGFLQGSQHGYWECGKRTPWQGVIKANHRERTYGTNPSLI